MKIIQRGTYNIFRVRLIYKNFTFVWPCIVTNFFIIKPTRCTNFTNSFCHEILLVSDSFSAHHQEFTHCTLNNVIQVFRHLSSRTRMELHFHPGPARKLSIYLEHGFVWCWNLELRAADQKYLESFEMWCWRRMEKISWTDHVRNEEVLLRINEQRNILHEIRKQKANWIGHILRRNCLLKQVIEGR